MKLQQKLYLRSKGVITDEKRKGHEAQEQIDEAQAQIFLGKSMPVIRLININKMGNNCCAQDH